MKVINWVVLVISTYERTLLESKNFLSPECKFQFHKVSFINNKWSLLIFQMEISSFSAKVLAIWPKIFSIYFKIVWIENIFHLLLKLNQSFRRRQIHIIVRNKKGTTILHVNQRHKFKLLRNCKPSKNTAKRLQNFVTLVVLEASLVVISGCSCRWPLITFDGR